MVVISNYNLNNYVFLKKQNEKNKLNQEANNNIVLQLNQSTIT
jgi:hypothetical protein